MKKKMRVLIGYDGSPCANAALDDLKKAGLPRQTNALVLSAADVFLPSGPNRKIDKTIKASVLQWRANAKNQLNEAMLRAREGGQRVKSSFPAWTVQSEACADSPAWAVLKKSDDWKADLILMGAHGHSKMGRFLGSVSQMVLTQSETSVRIGRPSPNTKEKRARVLIAIDGSIDSAAAVRVAAKRRWPYGVTYMLVSVLDPKKSSFMERLAAAEVRWLLARTDDDREMVGRMLESFAKSLRRSGATVNCVMKKGDPKHVLVKEAEAWQADSIFIGARGLTHLKRFFMGGVSTAVATRASCSVEVVKR